MKCHVFITGKVIRVIQECVTKADNNYETGGILMGYNLGRIYFIVAVTTPDNNINSSKVSFVLDGVEHTRKVNDVIMTSSHMCTPSVLGIWHSHICDGHNFSQQDKVSNMTLAKSLGSVLSMLVTKSAHTILFSISHISAIGIEEDCAIKFQAKAGMEVKSYERKRKMQ